MKAHSKEAVIAINTLNVLFNKDDREFNAEKRNFNEFRKASHQKDEKTNWDKSYDLIVETETPMMVIELLEAVVTNHVQRIEAILDLDVEYALMQDRFGNTAMSLAMKLGADHLTKLMRLRIKSAFERRAYA